MGTILSYFRSPPASVLHDIDQKLKSIVEFQEVTFERETEVLKWLPVFFKHIYVVTLLAFLYSSLFFKEVTKHFFVGILFFYMLFLSSQLSRNCITWHYNRLIVKSSKISAQLLKDRQKMLETVMNTIPYREAKVILDTFTNIPHIPRIIELSPETIPTVFQQKKASGAQFRKNDYPASYNNSYPSESPSTGLIDNDDEISTKCTQHPQQQWQTTTKLSSPYRPNNSVPRPQQSPVARPVLTDKRILNDYKRTSSPTTQHYELPKPINTSIPSSPYRPNNSAPRPQQSPVKPNERSLNVYRKASCPTSQHYELDATTILKREVKHFYGKLEQTATIRNGQETVLSARLTTASVTARQTVSQGVSATDVKFLSQTVVYRSPNEHRSLESGSSSVFGNNLMISSSAGSNNNRNRRRRQKNRIWEQQL